MSRLRDDLRDSLRSLRRTPVFTAAVIGILALGIGANTAIFSRVEPLIFSRLAISEPDRVVRLFAVEEDGGLSNSSYPVYELPESTRWFRFATMDA
jgi:putative ABC transport system permease protein